MLNKLKIISAALLLVVTASSLANEGAIKHRKNIMTAIGGHMQAMVRVLKGEVPFKQDLQFHSQAMSELANISQKVFPDDSQQGKTHALAEIWEEPEAFKIAMDDFIAAADTLNTAAKTGDMQKFGPAFKTLGGSCKACHDDFSEEH